MKGTMSISMKRNIEIWKDDDEDDDDDDSNGRLWTAKTKVARKKTKSRRNTNLRVHRMWTIFIEHTRKFETFNTHT